MLETTCVSFLLQGHWSSTYPEDQRKGPRPARRDEHTPRLILASFGNMKNLSQTRPWPHTLYMIRPHEDMNGGLGEGKRRKGREGHKTPQSHRTTSITRHIRPRTAQDRDVEKDKKQLKPDKTRL
ncbi:hypothetical protein QCA50_015356 [Cerrena zonata]|uniref:Uncharacterized protein n=1 Tax=Cerrena zonata TaxID=2478898 RepID=A0AAW0FIT4_9APHY